jgi:hypothetical protein
MTFLYHDLRTNDFKEKYEAVFQRLCLSVYVPQAPARFSLGEIVLSLLKELSDFIYLWNICRVNISEKNVKSCSNTTFLRLKSHFFLWPHLISRFDEFKLR